MITAALFISLPVQGNVLDPGARDITIVPNDILPGASDDTAMHRESLVFMMYMVRPSVKSRRRTIGLN